MTNINRVRLPHHRRRNWRIAFRDLRFERKVWLVFAAFLLGIALYAGEGWLKEILRRIDAEHANADLSADTLRLANFGKITMTDYAEGTTNLIVRRPK